MLTELIIETKIATVPMSQVEARECVDTIRAGLVGLRRMIWDLYQREGWKALGYDSWRECVVAEFPRQQSYLYYQLKAAEMEQQISTKVEIGTIPERQLRPLSRLQPEQRRDAWEMAVETAPDGKPTGVHVARIAEAVSSGCGIAACPACGKLYDGETFDHCPYCYKEAHGLRGWIEDLPEKVNGRPHVAHNSGNNEWYTPPEYIEAARCVMGDIDLDPASSEIANKTVRAATFYTQDDDGLLYDWAGRVWMNPPYASHLIGLFANKLAEHVKQGDVSEACVLVNNATETTWFNTLLDVASCVCFIRGRVKFIDAEGKPSGAPLQGQALLYIGPRVQAFGRAFSDLGAVLYAGRDTEQG